MSLTVFMGCMFSGKTTRLIQEYGRWKAIHKRTLVINHTIDDRYTDDEKLCSHDLVKVPCTLVSNLSKIEDHQITEVDAIFINEGQFFPDLLEKCLRWVEDMHKHVYVAGLDGDRYRKPFGQMLDLIPYSTDYEKLQPKCMMCLDGTSGCFTYDQSHQHSDDQIKVGAENYIPLCRQHYVKLISVQNSDNVGKQTF